MFSGLGFLGWVFVFLKFGVVLGSKFISKIAIKHGK